MVQDILPYDHSRVILPAIPGVEGSDFINANYLTNMRDQVRVIAAQGPLTTTVIDFWRMLWSQRTSVVVMVARVVEMGKVGLNSIALLLNVWFIASNVCSHGLFTASYVPQGQSRV